LSRKSILYFTELEASNPFSGVVGTSLQILNVSIHRCRRDVPQIKEHRRNKAFLRLGSPKIEVH
jgi:hypothetical protein